MKRSLKSYANCTADAIADGSRAQALFFVSDAKSDIVEMATALQDIETRMDSIDGSVTKTSIMKIIASILK